MSGRVCAVLLCVLLVAGCQQKALQEKEHEVISVKAVAVVPVELNESVDYVGDIRAQDEAQVYPKVSGKVIEKVKEDGSPVNKGDTLLYIDRDEVGLKYERAPVESPLAGVVGRLYVDIGQNVTPQTPVALVVNMSRMKITVDIPERYLPAVSVGQGAEIEVDAYPQQKFAGVITKVSPVVDLGTRTAPVEVTLENPHGLLKSGMFARVKLIIGVRKDALTVLKEAIIGKEPDTYVYTVRDGRAALRKVALGIRQGPYYEITQGLQAGDRVVIMGQQKLYDGAAVSVEEEQR